MMAMKKIALAISMETPAMPPKPKMPAISAMIKKVTTQPSMTRPLFGFDRRDRPRQCLQNQSGPDAMVPGCQTLKICRMAEQNGWLTREKRAPETRGINPVKTADRALY